MFKEYPVWLEKQTSKQKRVAAYDKSQGNGPKGSWNPGGTGAQPQGEGLLGKASQGRWWESTLSPVISKRMGRK